MDLDTLKELKLFQVELIRWKWFLMHNEMIQSNLPDFIKAEMNIEQIIEYVLKDNSPDNEET